MTSAISAVSFKRRLRYIASGYSGARRTAEARWEQTHLAKRVTKDAFSNFLGEDKFGVAERKLSTACLSHPLVYTYSAAFVVHFRVYVPPWRGEEVEETRTRFDSWATRPGIFLIHSQRVTYCDATGGIIETARL